MKKGLVVVGECILLITILVIVRIILGIIIPSTENSTVISFILYCISAFGGVFVYKLNAKK